MKPSIVIVVMILFAAPASLPGQTEDLVAAAKEAKKKRKNPASKPMTNADVKKSTGKLIELPPSDDPAGTEKAKERDPLSPLQRQDLERRQRVELEEKIAAAEARVADLQRELDSIESRYYEENDPNRRDTAIREQFITTKKALVSAKSSLDALKHPSPSEPGAPSPEPGS